MQDDRLRHQHTSTGASDRIGVSDAVSGITAPCPRKSRLVDQVPPRGLRQVHRAQSASTPSATRAVCPLFAVCLLVGIVCLGAFVEANHITASITNSIGHRSAEEDGIHFVRCDFEHGAAIIESGRWLLHIGCCHHNTSAQQELEHGSLHVLCSLSKKERKGKALVGLDTI